MIDIKDVDTEWVVFKDVIWDPCQTKDLQQEWKDMPAEYKQDWYTFDGGKMLREIDPASEM